MEILMRLLEQYLELVCMFLNKQAKSLYFISSVIRQDKIETICTVTCTKSTGLILQAVKNILCGDPVLFM
jgi:hypothetical protein